MTHAQLSPLLKLLKSPACRLYNEAGCQTFPLKYLGFGILKLGLTASAWVEALHVGCCAPDGDGQRPSRAFPATALSQGRSGTTGATFLVHLPGHMQAAREITSLGISLWHLCFLLCPCPELPNLPSASSLLLWEGPTNPQK